MDSGRFESVSRPYSFHQVMRGLFVPLRLATDARRLEFVTDLDPCIDKVTSSICTHSRSPSPSDLTRDEYFAFFTSHYTLLARMGYLTAELRSHGMLCS